MRSVQQCFMIIYSHSRYSTSLQISYGKSRKLSFSNYFSSSDAQSLSLVIFRISFAELHAMAILFYSKFINRTCMFAERTIEDSLASIMKFRSRFYCMIDEKIKIRRTRDNRNSNRGRLPV